MIIKMTQTLYPNGYKKDIVPIISEMEFTNIQAGWSALCNLYKTYESIYYTRRENELGNFNCSYIKYEDEEDDYPFIDIKNPPKKCPIKDNYNIIGAIDHVDYYVEWKLETNIDRHKLVLDYLNSVEAFYIIESKWTTDDGDYFLIKEGTTEFTTYVLRVKDGVIYNFRNEIIKDYMED